MLIQLHFSIILLKGKEHSDKQINIYYCHCNLKNLFLNFVFLAHHLQDNSQALLMTEGGSRQCETDY